MQLEADQDTDQEKSSKLWKAEQLFSERLFEDALSIYDQIVLQMPNKKDELKDRLLCRIATCHLEMDKPEQVLRILLGGELFEQDRLLVKYLLGCAYKKLGLFLEGTEAFSQISETNGKEESLLSLERGILFSLSGDVAAARRTLTSIQNDEMDQRPFILARLQLIKIDLLAGDWESAQQSLSALPKKLESPLDKQRIYLEGVLFSACNAPNKVIASLERLQEKDRTAAPFVEILYRAYLQEILRKMNSPSELTSLLQRAEYLLQSLAYLDDSERSIELTSLFYLIKSRTLQDEKAYRRAKEMLLSLSRDREIQQAIALQLAEGAPTYQERNNLYIQLINNEEIDIDFMTKTLTLKGFNHFLEALKARDSYDSEGMKGYLEEAIEAFDKAFLSSNNPQAILFKHKVFAHILQGNKENIKKGWETIRLWLVSTSNSEISELAEIYQLTAWVALQTEDKDCWQVAKDTLTINLEHPPSKFIRKQLYAQLCLNLNQIDEAEKELSFLLENSKPDHNLGQVLFLLALCAERHHKKELKQHYLQRVFAEDPTSAVAPIAYFHLYTYSDYVYGNRHVLKHLKAMSTSFPFHPLLINAYYLMGLCLKKDQLSEEGQLVHRKDLIAAIEAFQSAENTFDALLERNAIPMSEFDYYQYLRHRTKLERGQLNFAIAKQSTKGKREIYLEYAAELYKELISQLDDHNVKLMMETLFHLAQTLNALDKAQEAEQQLELSLYHANRHGLTIGYWLSKAWAEKGEILQQRGDYPSALHALLSAESASENVGLSPDEKLDLWIKQSLCHQKMEQFDEAMRLLSRAINDDVISSLRIKAMFLRAEIYELQNRPELALKQLQSTARKGGEWAQKAQKKLEESYGY